LSEQYRTSSQTFAQALRQAKCLPQVAQTLMGKSDLWIIFGIQAYVLLALSYRGT
jgi:hypothetical protein